MQTKVVGRLSRSRTGKNVSFTTVMTVAGLAVTVSLGTWLTAVAAVAGDPTATFVRFAGSVLVGAYYLLLFHYSRGRRFFSAS
ncbi:MAG: hypothetical protein ACR2QO_28350 [Acidimicrobiales bacterium]